LTGHLAAFLLIRSLSLAVLTRPHLLRCSLAGNIGTSLLINIK